MGMTMTQKILAAHAGLESVVPGQLIEANLDLVLANDITGPVAIHEVEKLNKKTVFDKDKIALVPDHFAPNKDIKSAEHCKCVREYAKAQGITNYFEVGEMGIEHALLPEKGLIVAGETCIGADSHTCTYGALGAFSTGVGSTDMGAGMITGQAWFKVPSAIKVELTGELKPWVSGKDVILHLIGKIGVDEKILNKPGKLTKEEFEIMKTHTVIGAEMLEQLGVYQDEPLVKIAHQICRWHHERYDGKGYPDGLVGDEIPISAQVVSVADVYDALASERVYKKAVPHEKVLEMILHGECGQFNPILIECLQEISSRIRSECYDEE